MTTQGGEVTTLELPEDYDPNDDDGRWLMQQVVPEELRDGIGFGGRVDVDES